MQTPKDREAGAPADHAQLTEDIGRFLADGLALKRWWDAEGAEGRFAERFDLVHTYNRPDRSFGFFDEAPLDGGRSMPIMGVIDEAFYDRPKANGKMLAPTVEWVQEQLREFVLHYFLRVSSFRLAEKIAPEGQDIPDSEIERKGMRFEQVLAQKKGAAAAEPFLAAEAALVSDLREVGEIYDWLALKLRIYDFTVDVRPFGNGGPRFALPLKEESYLVVTPDFVTDRENPAEGVLGEYGFGYAFVKNSVRGPFAYGPGEFEAAFQTINFRLLESGEIFVRMTFVSNRPDRIVNLSLDPLDWGFDLSDRMSFGLGGALTGPLRQLMGDFPGQLSAPLKRVLGGLPDDAEVDPVLASIALLNLLTGGQAAKRLNISREELNRGFLVQHSMQHYQTALGSLRTWRQVPDWLDGEALPGWVRNAASS